MSEKFKARVMDEKMMARALCRLSHEILERNKGVENTVFVGILRRGAPMAHRLSRALLEVEGAVIPVGAIDVTLYRDDLATVAVAPQSGGTNIPFDLNGKNVILVDDVISTGRTVRAAIDAIFRLARPRTIQLAVMIDRGLRELPIRADFVGKNLPTSHSEVVAVSFNELDGVDAVDIFEKDKES